ncbi:MAG TPA: dihydroorotase [Candidatus Saccharimonadales bacterium]|nr:dihydroorotase [Candidatus Saccharimonadales bacterium]
MRILLKNSRLIDPAGKVDETLDVLIDDGKIARVGASLQKPDDARVYDLAGFIVAPGFVDMHVHLREPGREDKETIRTGGQAAAAGGFTSVACMPNTAPVNDEQSVTDFILSQARRHSPVNVYPIGAISKGLEGKELSEIGDLVARGCVAISDDGRPVESGFLMRRALEYSKMFGIPVITHSEDLSLANGGQINEGYVSTLLGMKGLPAVSEESMIWRDIRLAEMTGGRLHVAHISTAGAVQLIREGKSRGVSVTAEATPHHFTLTEEAVREFDTNTKMKPPLRTEEDRQAVLEGLKDGTIDAVATDHAPHCTEEKEVEYDSAPFGVIGLETSVSLGLDRLVGPGLIGLSRFVELYSCAPARILGIPKGRIEVGGDADLTVFSLDKSVVVDPSKFRSKSRNTPFAGMTLRGAPLMSIVAGEVVHSAL